MWKRWRRRVFRCRQKRGEGAVFGRREAGRAVVAAAALTALFSYVFYQSWLGALLFPAVCAFCISRGRERAEALQKRQLSLQFTDTILSVTASLQTGHSAENAFMEAEGEIRSLHGPECRMARELELVRRGLENAVPLEQLLQSFGQRSGVEEIRDFAEVFAVAKRAGGNLREMIRRTALLTRQRLEVEREIQEMLAARRFELKVMYAVPFFLYAYIRLSSPGFFDVLYHNRLGALIMTFCLGLYAGACLLAERMAAIRL